MNQLLVSICIPTYGRCQFLREAIKSCIDQDYRPLEILIGDDSAAIETKNAVESFPTVAGLSIFYFSHQRRLGQAQNLNYLMSRVRGDFFIVLHDDDLLVRNSITKLRDACDAYAGAIGAFGLQYLVGEAGHVLCNETREMNRFYNRTLDRSGEQKSIMASALTRQFPCDGFLLRKCVADQVKYRSEAIVGTGCDFDFGIQIARSFGSWTFIFIGDYTSKYRIHGAQISANPIRLPMYYVLADMEVDERDREHLFSVRNIFAERAVHECLLRGDRTAARKIFFSPYFPGRRRRSLKGLGFLLAIVSPFGACSTWRLLRRLAGRPSLSPAGSELVRFGPAGVSDYPWTRA